MEKILCIGSIAYDVTIQVDGFPTENTKYRVQERVECGGGQAATAAFLLGTWGIPVAYMGSVGTDIFSQRVLWELKDAGVDTHLCKMLTDKELPQSVIIANKRNGSRTTFSYRGEDLKLTEYDVDFEPKIILVDGMEYEAAKYNLEKYPNAISIIDAGRLNDEVLDLCNKVTFVVCSKNFAEEYTDIKIKYNDNNKSLMNVLKKMNESFKGSVLITLESKGCAYIKGNTVNIMPSIKVKAVDSTGAGDIFHGAFAYGVYNSFPIEKTIKISNIAGGLSVTQVGSKNSVFPLEKVLEIYEANKEDE